MPEVDTAVRSLTVMWDGSLVVAANNHGTCYVWRLLRGNQVRILSLTCYVWWYNHRTCYVWRLVVALSIVFYQLIMFCLMRHYFFMQTMTNFEPLHKLQAHDGYILKCLLSPEFCDPHRFYFFKINLFFLSFFLFLT